MSDPSRIPPAVLAAHRQLREQLDARQAEVNAKRFAAKKVISECDEQDEQIKGERTVLAKVEALYERLPQAETPLTLQLPPMDFLPLNESSAPAPKRARIGPQRYLMLSAIHKAGALDISELVNATGLPMKRVREQMWSDMSLGIVQQVEMAEVGRAIVRFRLTIAGGTLLQRFEEYRRSRGMALPTREDALAHDDEVVENEEAEDALT